MDYPNNILPKESICNDCIHCMLKIIEPLDYEEFDLNEEAESEILVQSFCLLSSVDLHDHIVRKCSHFEHNEGNLLMGSKFLV